MPPIGVLNVAAMPPPAPAAISRARCRTGMVITCPSVEPKAAPTWMIGPSRPTEPPLPIEMAEASDLIIYTTNATESLNSKLRSSVHSRGHFPTDDAAIKLLYLVLRGVSKDWKMPQREWTAAKTPFAVLFGDRFSIA